MAYMRTYNRLGLACLTAEQRDRTCGYWYCVDSHGTPQTAFRTRAALLQWLALRGLSLGTDLPPEGQHKFMRIVGEYHSAMHMDRSPWDAIEGLQAVEMSNAKYTIAKFTRDAAGVVTEHTLNPNVPDRPEFDNDTCRRLQDAGQAHEIPAPVSGELCPDL